MKRRILVIFCMAVFVIQFANGQVRQVIGTVISADDGLFIPGASVTVKGTIFGIMTS